MHSRCVWSAHAMVGERNTHAARYGRLCWSYLPCRRVLTLSSHFKMLTERVRHTIRLTLHAEFEFKMTKFEDMTIHELCVEYFRMIVYSENNTSSVGTWADRCAGEYPLVTAWIPFSNCLRLCCSTAEVQLWIPECLCVCMCNVWIIV